MYQQTLMELRNGLRTVICSKALQRILFADSPGYLETESPVPDL